MQNLLFKFIRICSWITLILGSLTAAVGVIMLISKPDKVSMVISSLFFLSMAITGWNSRKFGHEHHSVSYLAKVSALVSLVFGLVLIILLPVLFSNLFGFEDSFVAIRNILILFTPMVVSAIAILFSRRIQSISVQKEGV
jgi:hypothetical protein